jgi:hypothetical protein
MLDNKKDRSTPALPQARDDMKKLLGAEAKILHHVSSEPSDT